MNPAIAIFGIPTGTIGDLACFDSIKLDTYPSTELSEDDFGGEPVRVKVWSPEQEPIWFGIANVTTVEAINDDRKAKRQPVA